MEFGPPSTKTARQYGRHKAARRTDDGAHTYPVLRKASSLSVALARLSHRQFPHKRPRIFLSSAGDYLPPLSRLHLPFPQGTLQAAWGRASAASRTASPLHHFTTSQPPHFATLSHRHTVTASPRHCVTSSPSIRVSPCRLPLSSVLAFCPFRPSFSSILPVSPPRLCLSLRLLTPACCLSALATVCLSRLSESRRARTQPGLHLSL